MIEITNYNVWGFEGAIRGMRMPYESFGKSDSGEGCKCGNSEKCWNYEFCANCPDIGFIIGDDDMALCKKLIKAGSEHRKFLRMIHVQAEVRAPRYWWQEARTYKYFLRLDPNGLDMNSSSTMHLITKRELTEDDFSFTNIASSYVHLILSELNKNIRHYNDPEWKEHKDEIFMNIKEMLPEAFMQRVMVDTNYEALLGIYHQRHAHRLSEWKDFCSWLEGLPYMEEFLEAMK